MSSSTLSSLSSSSISAAQPQIDLTNNTQPNLLNQLPFFSTKAEASNIAFSASSASVENVDSVNKISSQTFNAPQTIGSTFSQNYDTSAQKGSGIHGLTESLQTTDRSQSTGSTATPKKRKRTESSNIPSTKENSTVADLQRQVEELEKQNNDLRIKNWIQGQQLMLFDGFPTTVYQEAIKIIKMDAPFKLEKFRKDMLEVRERILKQMLSLPSIAATFSTATSTTTSSSSSSNNSCKVEINLSWK